MNRWWIFIFVLNLATGNVLFSELGKVAFMVGHYQEHREENPEMCFLRFLALHYHDSDHQKSDHQHNHLPFHSVAVHGFAMLQPESVDLFYHTDEQKLVFTPKIRPFEADMVPSPYLFSIFRPPLVA